MPVKVPLLRVQLKGEASSVPNAVCRASLWFSRREAGKELSFLANATEEIGISELRGPNISNLEFTISPSSLGVDMALRNSFMHDMLDDFHQVNVLEEVRPVERLPNSMGRLWRPDKSSYNDGSHIDTPY